MRDETIEALDGLARPPEFAVSDSIAQTRGEVETRLRNGWHEAGAIVTTERAVLLLFDILAGITLGHLRHDQTMWVSHVEALTDDADRSACGTYRCVAGWIAHLAHPGAVLDTRHRYRTAPSGHYRATESDALALPDQPGRNYTIRTVAAAFLLDMPPREILDRPSFDIPRPVRRMFNATARLVDLWERAFEMTGGIITIPPALREQVEATRNDGPDDLSPVDDLIGATGYDAVTP